MSSIALDLQADLQKTVEFFRIDEFAMQLPFVHSFPRNCCEVVSAFLAGSLAIKYEAALVSRVHGTAPTKDEHHFWVEVNGYVIDPTAHQFDGISDPFVCNAPGPLSAVFPQIERKSATQAIAALISLGVTIEAQEKVLARLSAMLVPNPS